MMGNVCECCGVRFYEWFESECTCGIVYCNDCRLDLWTWDTFDCPKCWAKEHGKAWQPEPEYVPVMKAST